MFQKIIVITIVVIIIAVGLQLLTQKESEELTPALPVQGDLTLEECAEAEGRVLDTANTLMCDKNEISIGEIGGEFAYSHLCCVPFPESKKLIIEEAMEIAQNTECTEKGDLTDNYIYNPNSKTWWIDLDMKQEFKKEYCNPACVVEEYTKTAEINWRCMGALPPEDHISDFLENLKQETEIDFSEIKDVEFKWVVNVDPQIKEEAVLGKGLEADVVPSNQYDSIYSFFIDNGFKTDIYNFAAGTISGLTGYKKDKFVCVVSGGLTGYKEAEGQWTPTDTDNWDIVVKCGELQKIEMEYITEDWQVYTNEKYGYFLKYPQPCLFGPLPGYCKQSPPEERPRECRCYFNAEDPNSVSLGTFTGTKSDLTGAFFDVFHSIYVDHYSPPAGTDLVDWVKENFPHYQNIPNEINMEIDGIPAVKVYTPFSGMAWSQEDIYFIKGGKVFKISMLDVDNEDNRELYDKILFTFKISK